ncbi:MAG TPA: hypothetical protein VN646_18625 [Candidatus Acidoferrum sp.]|nr:hypothetical protein [Candidatus Acidoferrum sp.]
MNDRGHDIGTGLTHIRVDADAIVDGTRVQLDAELLIVVHKDDRAQVYVSQAPALNVYSQGRTEHEAVLALEQAIRSYIITAHGRGYLERILLRSALRSTDDRIPRQYVRIAQDRPEPNIVDTPAAVELSAL